MLKRRQGEAVLERSSFAAKRGDILTSQGVGEVFVPRIEVSDSPEVLGFCYEKG